MPPWLLRPHWDQDGSPVGWGRTCTSSHHNTAVRSGAIKRRNNERASRETGPRRNNWPMGRGGHRRRSGTLGVRREIFRVNATLLRARMRGRQFDVTWKARGGGLSRSASQARARQPELEACQSLPRPRRSLPALVRSYPRPPQAFNYPGPISCSSPSLPGIHRFSKPGHRSRLRLTSPT